MVIKIPSDLTFYSTIEFCEYLDDIDEEDTFTFDYETLATVEPFGMLLVGAKLRQFMKRFPNAEYLDRNFKHHTYAANMGFFKSVYQDYGEMLYGGANYIPITKIDVSKIIGESKGKREHIVDTVERESARLSQVLSKGNKGLKDVLTYSIREIMRNTIEHSESDCIWFAAQYWPTKNRVEVAILDEGIGIKKSLGTNPRLKIKTQKDALLLALEPGITRKIFNRFDRDDPYANTGFGLFLTSRICKNGGDFAVCGGSKILALNKRGSYFFNTSFSGTAIRMRLTISRLKKLEEILPILIKEGEKTASRNKNISVLSASKISSLLIEDD